MAHTRTEIAIIGLTARLPSGEHSSEDFNYSTLWDFLMERRRAPETLSSIFPDVDGLPKNGTFLKDLVKLDYAAWDSYPMMSRTWILTSRFQISFFRGS
ncbi:hypothetical protein C8J56DRAFT_1042850 [Mycena floridula]|nr:hypothetical protein C8J56DRAFT_1042850 [Mycena floridula]